MDANFGAGDWDPIFIYNRPCAIECIHNRTNSVLPSRSMVFDFFRTKLIL